MKEFEEIVDSYSSGFEVVRAAFSDLTPEQFLARPVSSKWSSLEVLCHLVDTDLMVASRLRMALTVNEPRLTAPSIEELSTILGANNRDPFEELTLFQMVRNQTARILRVLPAESRERNLVLVKAGGEEVTRSVRQMLVGITDHVTHHLRFVDEKRVAMGLSTVLSSGVHS